MDKINKNLKFLIVIRYRNLISSVVLICKNSNILATLRQKVLKTLTIKVNTPMAMYWYIPGKQVKSYIWFGDRVIIFGKLHRDNRPAIYWHRDGDQVWYQNGIMHRNNGPACVLFNYNKLYKLEWYKNGMLYKTKTFTF